ncbi:1-phosphofructokinase family hexose kinase [Marisediminicola sp. LYQ134]|uniref:1-phosphofructokinase family hexose kinase n=1 Tax=unclassified Marisediminicola TaxID=2618316 RepID=UPI003982EA42
MARVVVVTPNPAIDVTYVVAQQKLGETVRVRSVTRRAGGKGINVVRVLRSLGVDATAVHPLGGPNGEWMNRELASAGITSASVEVAAETRSTVAVVDSDLGTHPTVYTEPGTALDATSWARVIDAVERHGEGGGIVVIAGSFPPDTSDERVVSLVSAGKRTGARVIVDTTGPGLLAAAAARADILKPNESEVLDATGAVSLDDGIAALLERGAGAVVVSRGPEGLLLATGRGERVAHPAVPGVSGNPTGAGDAATAGLVFALLAGASEADALLSAAVVGAAAVEAPAAGEIDPASLPELASRLGARGLPPVVALAPLFAGPPH